MEMNREEVLKFIEDIDFSRAVALDIYLFSRSLNYDVGGRIQRADNNRLAIHTGAYGINLHIMPQHRADLYLVKKGKNGAEYVSHHFNIYTKEPFGDIVVALIDKIEKESTACNGSISKTFPDKRLSKCLSHSVVKVVDEEEEDDLEAWYGCWAGIYGNPYAHINRTSYKPKEKKFFFKEQGRLANISK